MARAFYRVDAFTDRLFGGNPACVFPDGRGLDDATMRAIAREMGAGATAFVLPPTRATCTHRVRFFKPMGEELKACGHATVATFAVLVARGEAGPIATMECGAGDVAITTLVDPRGVRVTALQGPGRFAASPVSTPEGVAARLGVSPSCVDASLPVELASTGGAWVALIPLRTVADVAACAPTADGVRALGAERVYPFAIARDGDRMRAHARYFFLEVNEKVDEDPVTGTAAGALAAWLDRHHRTARGDTLVIEQGIECRRPGVLHARVEASGQVAVTGSAVVALAASLDV